MPVQSTTAPGHGHDAKPAALVWAGLGGTGLQHGQPAAKDAIGRHRRGADHDGLAPAGGQHGDQDSGRG